MFFRPRNWPLVGKILEIGVQKTKAFVKYHSLIKTNLKKKTLFNIFTKLKGFLFILKKMYMFKNVNYVDFELQTLLLIHIGLVQ